MRIFYLPFFFSPTLHWRDIQELIVRTSNSDGLKYGEFKTNGIGRQGFVFSTV